MAQKIAVCYGVGQLEEYIQNVPDNFICLYLAHKDNVGWDKSTSRVYMNKLWGNFSYIPIDVEKDDEASLKRIYELADSNSRIIAINQTQPHKSNPTALHLYGSEQKSIDTLVKDESGKLKPLNLNGPSFVEWLKTELNRIEDFAYILLGVGGVGEPIARELNKYSPRKMFLVDPIDKSKLAQELNNCRYLNSLSEINNIETKSVLINAAGKEGADENSDIEKILSDNQNLVFIDLRPQIAIPEVEYAKKTGHKAYTGYGMNARNDYTLVEMIAEKIDQKVPSYDEFKKLVAQAS